jgi:MYXO-CTERM domain-containing protein
MRLAFFASASLALGLAASPAFATVTEPNGLQVPLDGNNGEEELYTFFPSQGESIDWQTDAHAAPVAFSPLCGFTATFMLNQAGSHFGLAWYNETGSPPAPSDLHVLLPANSPVGSMFNGTAIKNDPAYLGGLVGFALVGGETHYTNPAYDNVCTACSPPGPWITALMYASTKMPNAYYICFEDGGTDQFGWNNDGDFNDDVFFVTGITCQGGGASCDTGKPGICAAGLTQCSANGTTCQQLNQPQPEKCNGIDDDCNGMVDDGPNLCPTGQVCDMGVCVASCSNGEFVCPPDKVCSSDGHCIDPACKDVTCPSGQICVSGTCKGPCDGIVCPSPQVCRVGTCVDPCMGVMCDSGQVCVQGVCEQTCACQPCASGLACDMTSGQCVDPTCVGVTCIAGQHCVPGMPVGQCKDDCSGAVCPSGQTCMAGQCVAVMTGAGGAGGSTGVSFGIGGSGGSGAGAGGKGGASTGTAGHTTGSAATGGAGGSGTGSKGSCGCRAVGEDAEGSGMAVAVAALAFAAARRRRRR